VKGEKMMKRMVPAILILTLFLAHQAFASGLNPQVIATSGGNVIQLGVNGIGDASWMWRDFGDPIDTAVAHPIITVSFDMFLAAGYSQRMFYAFVDENDNLITTDNDYLYGNNDPYYGVVEQDKTLPLGWSDADPGYINIDSPIDYQVNTVIGDWVNVTLQWEFNKEISPYLYTGYVSAWYDTDSSGNPVAVVLNLPIDAVDSKRAETLNGWDFTLFGIDALGLDTVLIDNLVITGSDIYDSLGFENFKPGLLNGQYGWLAGTERGVSVIPEPTTMLLFGAGLLGLVGVSRRKK
jgi:hypothetical protein